MKLLYTLITAILLLASHATTALGVEHEETIKKTFRFQETSSARTVVVDNVFGSITVTGYDGDEVRVVAHKTIRARSDKKIREAQEEVQLDITVEDDFIELYVDGPFRVKRGREINWRGYEREGYRVTYEFDLKIPHNCSVVLKTVNKGEIFVGSIDGDFEVSNVNGGIVMENIGGSGEAHTVNGDITLEFDDNPEDDCSFKTINGEVRLYFLPGLSAQFNLKTFNGEIFTDFEIESMPPQAFHAKKSNGKKVYKAGHLCRVRAGKGGPEITMNGFNGDMFILEK